MLKLLLWVFLWPIVLPIWAIRTKRYWIFLVFALLLVVSAIFGSIEERNTKARVAAEAKAAAELQDRQERARVNSLLSLATPQDVTTLSDIQLEGIRRGLPEDPTTIGAISIVQAEIDRRTALKQREYDRMVAEAAATAQKKAAEEADFDGLVVLRKTLKSVDGEYDSQITGIIENRTGRKVGYVQVSFNLLDKDGVQVGTAFDNTTNLAPGSKWRFRASALGTRFRTATLAEVTGW